MADEIITSVAGVRVRVGNTDAEGRMVMADPLHHTSLQVWHVISFISIHIFIHKYATTIGIYLSQDTNQGP